MIEYRPLKPSTSLSLHVSFRNFIALTVGSRPRKVSVELMFVDNYANDSLQSTRGR